jgi:hypothetical protein
VRPNIPVSRLGVADDFCAVDLGNWIQGTGDGEEAMDRGVGKPASLNSGGGENMTPYR